MTNEKELYKKKCQFRFNVKDYEFIPGLEKLPLLGMYHPLKNPEGLCRDHMLSVEYGWVNNISPDLISHPANCQLITNKENILKNSNSCITLNQLKERIKDTSKEIIKTKVFVPKSVEHREKISKSIKGINLKRKEFGLPPLGGRPKLVPMVGVEPTSD